MLHEPFTANKTSIVMNRTVLITGATKGIGFATAERLANKGCVVIGIARNPSKITFPGTLFLVDLANPAATEKIFNEVNDKYAINGIINNVGLAHPATLTNIKLADFNDAININLRPVLQAAQIFVKKMIECKWGRIINISSRAILGLADRSVYSATKSALIGFTRSWALELAQSGVTVNAIAPGPIETETYRLHRPHGSEAAAKSLKIIPMGRVGKPVEVAATIEFLLSDEAGFITGQTLFVDGGASIGLVH